MQNITFSFPVNTQTSRNFLDCLQAILSEVPHSQSDNGLTLSALKPAEAYPVTNFCADELSDFPAVSFDAGKTLTDIISKTRPKQPVAGGVALHRLPITEITKRLQGHVTRIDHTGLNIPSKFVGRDEWDELMITAALTCNMYKYPTGEDWPFILPATKSEFETDITTFPVGRGPKFELVYDTFSSVPTIQIDLETDLERPQVERLFPAPYGISFPDLAEYFRTVFVHHEWAGINIRFDIRFKSTNPSNDWNTGKWLVVSGGRIKHIAS